METTGPTLVSRRKTKDVASAWKQTLKHIAIRSVLEAIAALRLDKVLPGAGGRGLIFTLHHVRPATNSTCNVNAHLEVTPEFLEQAILTAKDAGLTPVRLEDLPHLLSDENDRRRFVCFTLDDGNRDNATFAAPMFRKHAIPYTVFIAPGLSNRTHTMWWETLGGLLGRVSSLSFDFGNGPEFVSCKSAAQKHALFARFADFVETTDEDAAVVRIDALAISLGIDPRAIVEREILTLDEVKHLAKDPLVSFGGHTVSHCNLRRVDEKRLEDEIRESCQTVGDYWGQEVRAFAYPYGGRNAVSPREWQAAMRAGLKVAVTTQPGVLGADSPLTALHRVSLNGLYQKKRYVRALISGLPFRLL